MLDWTGMMASGAILSGGKSRAINAENPTGEKGKGGMASSVLGEGRKGSPCIPSIAPGETKELARIEGTGVIRHIWMAVTDKLNDGNRFVFRDLVLRMYWDNEETPSVECPLGDFFCCGFGRGYEVYSMPIVVAPRNSFNCYFPMPFRRGARITIENQNEEAIPSFYYQVDYCLYDSIPESAAYFHAQWRRSKITEIGKDHVILDGVRGRGQYIGTFLAISALERYWWGEGEVKFFLDGDDRYPTICGTGAEDYFGGAWSYAALGEEKMREITFCSPFLGYPFFSRCDDGVRSDYHTDECPPMRGLYRFHFPDPICFESDIKVTIQQIGSGHGGIFERQDDVATVAYWYQMEPHTSFPELPAGRERWPR